MTSSNLMNEDKDNESTYDDSFASYSDNNLLLLMADDSDDDSSYNEYNESTTETDFSCDVLALLLADEDNSSTARSGFDELDSTSTETGYDVSCSSSIASFDMSNYALATKKTIRDLAGRKHASHVRFGRVQVRRYSLVHPPTNINGPSLFIPSNDGDGNEDEEDKYFDLKTFEKAKAIRSKKCTSTRKRRPVHSVTHYVSIEQLAEEEKVDAEETNCFDETAETAKALQLSQELVSARRRRPRVDIIPLAPTRT